MAVKSCKAGFFPFILTSGSNAELLMMGEHTRNVRFHRKEVQNMSTSDIIRSLLELAAVIFVVWGLFNEEIFAKLENKFFAWMKRKRFKVVKNRPQRRKR